MKFQFNYESPFTLLSTVGLLMLLIGIRTPWVAAPLTSAHRLFEISFSGLEPGNFGVAFVTLVIAFVIFELAKIRWLSLLAAVAMLLVLATFALNFGPSDHPWILQFLSESSQRSNLQILFDENYWPNINVEPTTVLVSDFEYLRDRWALFWFITKFGFSVSVAGTLFLLLHCGFVLPRATAALLLASLALIFIAAVNDPAVTGELNHRRGDKALHEGRHVDAISAYSDAIAIDPMLGHSRAFAAKASYAYLRQEGPESILGRLATARSRYLSGEESAENMTSAYNTYYSLIEVDGYAASSPLEDAILIHTKDAATGALLRLGLAISSKDFSSSMVASARAETRAPARLDVAVMLAHAELRLGLTDAALPRLHHVLTAIENEGIRADVLCTLGDVYQYRSDFVRARDAYLACRDIDRWYNYRAVLNLGGT